MKTPLPPNARVLVVRLSALGDVVFAIPAVTALRQMLPDARIDWLVEDRHASLVRGLPMKDGVVVFPRSEWKKRGGLRRMWKHWEELRNLEEYDAVVDFQGNLKSSMQVRTVPSPLRIGFERGVSKEGAARRYHRCVANPGRVPRAERDMALVRELGWTGPAPDVGPWALPPSVTASIASALAADAVLAAGDGATHADDPQPLLLLHTSVTSYGKDKEWPVESWVELIRRLTDLGHRVRLLWTPGDRAHVDGILAQTPGAALAPETASLEHLMALLDQAALTIGTDSGPIHLAALRGNRVLGLYGPTDPVRFAPPGPHAHVMSALPLEQEPPKRDRSGRSPLMERIAPGTVLQKILELQLDQ